MAKTTISPDTLKRISAKGGLRKGGPLTGSANGRPLRKMSDQQLAILFQAFGGGGGGNKSPDDYLKSAQTKLAQSVTAINQSNAPLGYKGSATSKTLPSKSESFIDRVLNVANKPLSVTTAAVARFYDPKRNFLKDVRDNVNPTEIFATQDWFKELDPVSKIVIGLGASIALDPLTYLAPSAKLAGLGNAAGLSLKAENAAMAARAVGTPSKMKDAARLADFAGDLTRKGKGGIGGISSQDLAWIGKQIGVDDLKGGLYWTVPGTGPIAQRIGITPKGGAKQLYLGRPAAVTKISAGASNTLNRIKASKGLAEAVGGASGGGEGGLKRAILNAESTPEALAYRNRLNAGRVQRGGEGLFKMDRGSAFKPILDEVTSSGVDSVTLGKAMGGNKAAIAEVEAVAPGLVQKVLAFDAAWKPSAQSLGGSQLEVLGVNADQMQPLYRNDVDLHQQSVLTEEARTGVVGGQSRGNAKVGPEQIRNVEPGRVFMGETIRHPSEWTTRIEIIDKNGNTVEVLGVGLGRDKAATAAAEQAAGLSRIVDNPNVAEPMVRIKSVTKKGKAKWVTVPESQVRVRRFAPDKGGLGAREQANALYNQKNGFDLFDLDYLKGQERALNDYSKLYGEEVSAAYLRNRPVGDERFDVLLKDYPKSGVAAQKKIDKSLKKLWAAADAKGEARIGSLMAQSEAAGNIADSNFRLGQRIQELQDVLSKTPKDSPKAQQYRAALLEAQSEHAGLMGQIDSLTEKVASGKIAVADAEAEMARIAASGTIRQKGAQAAQNLAASGPNAVAGVVDPNAAVIPEPTAVRAADPAATLELKNLQSRVRDETFQLDSLKREPGVPQSEIDQAAQRLRVAQMKLDKYVAANPAGAVDPNIAGVAGVVDPAAPNALQGVLDPNAVDPVMVGAVDPTVLPIVDPIQPLPKLQQTMGPNQARFTKGGVETIFDAPKVGQESVEQIGGRINRERTLDAAKSNLEDLIYRREVAASKNPRLKGEGPEVRKATVKVEKAKADLAAYIEKNPFVSPEYRASGSRYAPEVRPVTVSATREEALATIGAERQQAVNALERTYNVRPENVGELIARQNAYDEASEAHRMILELGANPEQVANAERMMLNAQNDVGDLLRGEMLSHQTRLRSLEPVPSYDPPATGYSPEWEAATLQYVDDSSAVRGQVEVTINSRIAEIRKEVKAINRAKRSGVQNPKTTLRSWVDADDEMTAVVNIEKIVKDVDVRAAAAFDAAQAEALAWDRAQRALADRLTAKSWVPEGLRAAPEKDPAYMKYHADYRIASGNTTNAVLKSEQTQIAMRFGASTKGITAAQSERLLNAVDNFDVHNVIKQITKELGMDPQVAKSVQPAILKVGPDSQAVAAIHANAADPAMVQRVVQASTTKAAAVVALGAEPAVVPTVVQTRKVTAAAQRRIGELQKEVSAGKRANTIAGKKAAVLSEQANQHGVAIDALSQKLASMQKRKAALQANQTDTAWNNLADASKLQWDEAERAERSIQFALDAEAEAVMRLGSTLDEAEYVKFLHSGAASEANRYIVRKGFNSISSSSMSPQGIDDAVAFMTRVTQPDSIPKFLEYFDKFTRIFKSWAVATPGFIARNGYSGLFMNWAKGVDAGRTAQFLSADRAFRNGLKNGLGVQGALDEIVDVAVRDYYKQVHFSGVLELGGQVENLMADLKAVTGSRSKRGPLTMIADTPVNRVTYNVNREMERVLRGTAAMDAAAKGRGAEGIYDLVFQAHFDYSDLNNFETQWMKRISPFYTWFRKNLPTQMELVFKNPKAFARYAQARDTIEAVSDGEEIVPSWMTDRLSIRLPWSIPGGQMYVLPDMPIKDLNVLGNWNELLSQINPIIKTPIESVMDTKLFFGKSAPFLGKVQVPIAYNAVGLGAAMEALGFATRNEEGTLVAEDKHLYVLEQFLPFMGRARRLLPNEPKHQDRLPLTVVNTLLGLGLRANTVSDKTGEIMKRQKSVDEMAENLQKLGYGGYSYWKKQIITSRKPSATDKRPFLTLLQPKGGLNANSPYTNVNSGGTDWAAILSRMASANGSGAS